MLLRHRIFEEVNLQLVAKLHGANSRMLLGKLIQVAASPRGKRNARSGNQPPPSHLETNLYFNLYRIIEK